MPEERLQRLIGDMVEVATTSELQEAKRKGLYKAISAIPRKETCQITLGYIDEILLMIGKRIEEILHEWYKEGGNMLEAGGFDRGLSAIEDNLYIIEDLLPYCRKERRKNDADNESGLSVPTFEELELFHHLSRVKRRVAFPPTVEKFYRETEKRVNEISARSPLCDVCGEKGVDYDSGDTIAHFGCLVKNGWYQCRNCGWAYPEDIGHCKRKYGCGQGTIEICSNK